MTQPQIPPRPDTTDMMAVHGVFRQALGSAPALLGTTAATGSARNGAVASYYDNVLRLLRVHHDSEDQLVWPRLLERCPAHTALIAEMISDHHDVHTALERSAARASAWAASAQAADGRHLASALVELGQKLIPHLDHEEEMIVPLCSEYLTMEEWGEMPGHALAHFDGDKVWLVLGLISRQMTEPQRAAMFEHMPAPVLDMWTTMGAAAFDELFAELHGPPAG